MNITDMIISVFEDAPWVQEIIVLGLYSILVSRIQGGLGIRFFLGGFITLITIFVLSTVADIHDTVIKFAWVMTIIALGALIIKKDG